MNLLDLLVCVFSGMMVVVGGFSVRYFIIRARVQGIEILTNYAWQAVRVAKDKIKKDGRGADKMNIAMKILREQIGGKEEHLEQAIRAAYQQMKGLI